MGPSRALSSVLILIGASCPWPGLSFDSIVGLSRILSCKQQRFHTWKGDVTLSLYAEDAVVETKPGSLHQNLLELRSEFSKVTGHKLTLQSRVALLCPDNEHSGRKGRT